MFFGKKNSLVIVLFGVTKINGGFFDCCGTTEVEQCSEQQNGMDAGANGINYTVIFFRI